MAVEPQPLILQIIFIDSAVEGYEAILAAIDHGTEVVFLDADCDGVVQIVETLQGREDIDSIHIIAHGDVGELELDNISLTQESMKGEHAEQLQLISTAISEEADILIYGYSFAESTEGEAVANSLTEITDADIAASEDLTGHESLGGDRDLELETGEIESDLAFGQERQDDWRYVLAES